MHNELAADKAWKKYFSLLKEALKAFDCGNLDLFFELSVKCDDAWADYVASTTE